MEGRREGVELIDRYQIVSVLQQLYTVQIVLT